MINPLGLAAVVGAGEVRPLAVVGAAQPVRAISVHTLAVPVTVPLLRVAFALGVETAVVATTAVNALSTLFWGKSRFFFSKCTYIRKIVNSLPSPSQDTVKGKVIICDVETRKRTKECLTEN